MKTAGTSFRTRLLDWFPQEDFLEIYHLTPLSEYWARGRPRERLFAGHFGWFVPQFWGPGWGPLHVLTFLRSPANRLLSEIAYLRSWSAEQVQDHIENIRGDSARRLALVRELDPEDYLRTDDYLDNVSNAHVRALASFGESLPMGRADLERAKERLTNCAFFGIVEEMDWSMAVLSARFHLPFRPLRDRLNPTDASARIRAPELTTAAEAGEALDFELYAFGKALFEERVANLKTRFGLGPNDNPAALSDVFRVDFLRYDRGVSKVTSHEWGHEDGVPVEGFRSRYFDETSQRWLRWSGPDATSYIYLPLASGEQRKVRFEIVAAMNETIRDGLTFQVSGEPVGAKIAFKQIMPTRWITLYEITIPSALIPADQQFVEISVAAPEQVEVPGYGTGPSSMGAFALGKVWVL